MRYQCFSTAQADRQLHDLKMIEQREGFPLAAFDIEGEGRTRSRTLPVEHRLVGIALLEEAEIVHPGDLGMARQIFRDETGVGVRPRHADLERFERAHQHPTRVRIQLRANGAAPAYHLLHEAGVAADAAANEIAVAADILSQRTQRNVRAAFQRRLEHRASIVLSTTTGGLCPWDFASSSAIAAQAARST